MISEKENNEAGLKHGQFYVNCKTENNKITRVLVDPLSQDDYVNGWRMILPKLHKNTTTHHFSIYLSNLPPHLWGRLYIDKDDFYKKINDNIYTYSVKISKYDNELLNLYKYVNHNVKRPYDIKKISEYFGLLQEARIKGWIMTHSYNILQKYKQ